MKAFTPPISAIEPLESRIAPAALLPVDPQKFVAATLGAPVKVTAGQLLTTTGSPGSGQYLLFVEQGNAWVFFTDLNNNGTADYNELTGIAAGDGLRLTSFVDIHGDIATNLVEKTLVFPAPGGGTTVQTVFSLSDSDGNSSNDNVRFGGDGRVLLNNTIEKIELRSLTINDLTDQNGDQSVTDADVNLRRAPSTYSIFGNIYAGGGFGAADGGLIINATGIRNYNLLEETRISIGSIRVGTAASGQLFTFGASRADDASGIIAPFIPSLGQPGGSVDGLKIVDANGEIDIDTPFNIDGLYAGDGGPGAKGGDVKNITLTNDDTSGYEIVAGNGGRGTSGGDGGSVTNFTDLSSTDTGRIRIVTGSGGAGATGAGGNGGNLSFNTFNVLGEVFVKLGDGGDGFKTGGDGASLTKGKFTQPGQSGMVTTNVVGTTHIPDGSGDYSPIIGRSKAIDFDLDGFGDMVYTTTSGSQLVVAFGGAGGFRTTAGPDGVSIPDRIYLSAPHNPDAVTVADLNGDGTMDIATASNDRGAHGGVYVYLSYFEDQNNDGTLTPQEDANGNGVNDFLGFRGPIHSTMPLLSTGDPGVPALSILPFFDSPVQIGDIAAGDFDGDGNVELAVVATYYSRIQVDDASGEITLLNPSQVVVFLTPDLEFNSVTQQVEPTGQFFADFGLRSRVEVDPNTNLPVQLPAEPLAPFYIVNGGLSGQASIEATALSTAADHDVLIVGRVGVADNSPQRWGFDPTTVEAFGIRTLDYSQRAIASDFDVPSPSHVGDFLQGSVDTNRNTGPNDIALTPFAYQGSVVTDYDGDGLADVLAVSSAPDGFLIGIKGDGTGRGDQTSTPGGGQNAGDFFGAPPNGYDRGGGLLGIKVTARNREPDQPFDSIFDDFAIVNQSGTAVVFGEFNPGGAQSSTIDGFVEGRLTGANLGFDYVYNQSSVDLSFLPVAVFANSYDTARENNGLLIRPLDGPALAANSVFSTITFHGISITTGSGGGALIGSGGNGGDLGVPGKISTSIDPISGRPTSQFTPSVEITKSGFVRVIAGDGGEGFGHGGEGGSIKGVLARLAATGVGIGASLTAGNGGRGITGFGGDGGDVSQVSISGAFSILGGDGGQGVVGGNGGDILGNGTSLFDASSRILTLNGGDGGSGTKRGGNGGGVLNFHPFISGSEQILSGSVTYVGGVGGASVSGAGGAGGSILNSSPFINSAISGDVYLQAGDGGNGSKGGTGGKIDNFIYTGSIKPSLLTFIGGNGGFGAKGNGGTGGSISRIDVKSKGAAVGDPSSFQIYQFNRMIAGNGGDSALGNGGAGGDITAVSTGADQNGYAVVAGAGGSALKKGGNGGQINGLLIDLSADISKALVISGAGGDASAFVPNPNDGAPNQGNNSFGGKVGKGGNGGNISNFRQTGNNGVHVDLIAGNGGDSINYGHLRDKKNFVGQGGSVQDISIVGDIGNISPVVAIKSYNAPGQSIEDYVVAKFRSEDFTDPAIVSLSDFDGNVGIVVGTAGRNKAVVIDPVGNPYGYETQPAPNSKSGSLINLTAANLMSAVAGSVDRISVIQVIKGLRVTGPILSADKSIIGVREYLNKDGVLSPTGTPVREGKLIDGAVVTKSLLDGAGKPTQIEGVTILS